MKRTTLIWMGFLWGPVMAIAQAASPRVSFPEVWKQVSQHSPSLQAADASYQAAQASESRAKGHWFPKVYLDARAYRTDDPSRSFMSALESREIGATDFSPSTLNHPEERFYGQETLGLEWALYEGGARKAMADSSQKVREAKGLEWGATRAARYAQTAGSYAVLLTLEVEHEKLENMSQNVEGILKNYFIGAKSNPVGYSGLLGLKTLVNHLAGLKAENQAKSNTIRANIRLQAENLPLDWVPAPMKVMAFLDETLPELANPTEPSFVRAAQVTAEAVEKAKNAQTAALLPRVALFGEGALNNSDRGNATGYTAGVYLQWSLLDVTNFKAGKEAEASAKAAKAQAESIRRQAESDRLQSQESLQALKTNMVLMDDSDKLLEEQAETAKNLFKNGSINALQLVEVLSRRVDLIDQQAMVEMEMAKARVLSAVNSGMEEPAHEVR